MDHKLVAFWRGRRLLIKSLLSAQHKNMEAVGIAESGAEADQTLAKALQKEIGAKSKA